MTEGETDRAERTAAGKGKTEEEAMARGREREKGGDERWMEVERRMRRVS